MSTGLNDHFDFPSHFSGPFGECLMKSGATESEGELYVALTAMCAPFPLGGAARGAPRTDVVRRTSAHTCAPPKGVAWGGAEGGCARGHGSSPSWAGGGAVWGGVPPLGAATQIHAETPCLHLLQRTSADVGELPAWCFSSRLRRRTAGAAPLCHLTVDRQSALERLGNGPTPPRDLLHARWPV